jgi:hypothetical protein
MTTMDPREVFAASANGRLAVGPVERASPGGRLFRVGFRTAAGATRLVGVAVPAGADAGAVRSAFVADLSACPGATVSVAADVAGLIGTPP